MIAADVLARRGECPSGAAGLARWLGVPYRRSGDGEHDVTTSEFDEPARTPRRTLVLAATYRSGSTALAEDLVRAGGYGTPVEYFQAGAEERRFARFAGPDYRRRVMSHRTTATGVFGVKVFPADLRAQPGLWESLPSPVVVRVRRHDRVGQAVSAWRALNGGPWRGDGTRPAPPAAPYDYEMLRRLVGLFAGEDAWWDRLVPPATPTVWFEDLVADHDTTVARLLTTLADVGLPPDRPPGPPRLARQADADSAAMVARFLADHRDRANNTSSS